MSWKQQKKKGFGYGGFSLSSSFHKSGELSSFKNENKGDGWRGKHHNEEE